MLVKQAAVKVLSPRARAGVPLPRSSKKDVKPTEMQTTGYLHHTYTRVQLIAEICLFRCPFPAFPSPHPPAPLEAHPNAVSSFSAARRGRWPWAGGVRGVTTAACRGGCVCEGVIFWGLFWFLVGRRRRPWDPAGPTCVRDLARGWVKVGWESAASNERCRSAVCPVSCFGKDPGMKCPSS